jgi:hypothetical protein
MTTIDPSADWYCRQAAEYFRDSLWHHKSARSRETARKKFLENAREAIAIMGADPFLELFKQCCAAFGYGEATRNFAIAEAAIRDLKPAGRASDATRLAAIGKLCETLVRLAVSGE